MLNLPRVTCIALTGLDFKYQEHLEAIKKSQEGIRFGAVKLIQDDSIKSLDEYSWHMLHKLTDYVETDFALTVQADGYVTNPLMWTDEFLEFDYLGAPWPPATHYTKTGKEVRVGNGGFTLRSKKLMDSFNDLGLEFTDNGTGYWHEDGNYCVYYRDLLESKGFKFAPPDLAARFSTELQVPETTESFGKHKYF